MITIIIPYYKRIFFEETLQSLAKQTDKRFKVFIGDDASPEDPTKLLEQFKGLFDFKYKKFKTNLGAKSLVQHWERCIALAVEDDKDWLLILGDDDILGKNVIDEFYKNLDEVNELNINVIKFSTVVIDEFNKPITKVFKSAKIEKSTDAFYNKISDSARSSLSEHIFRTAVYKEKGFQNYSLAWHSDDMAWLQFTDFENIYSLNNALVSIRVSNNSISGSESNSIEKNKASYQFYHELIYKYFNNFSWRQKNLILRIFETKTLLVKGKKISSFYEISFLFLKNRYVFSFFRFTFRFLIKHKAF
ncbi:GT2 family glycosyltransferase [Lutibacter oceani]|uniref:GT2 family glycosyltransferase n=1 Tax=Lutibacter oceani TaxID=1853311 RepID=A0A3D9S2K2_9FLAO|nr:glycosyltransferase [Lutibacter oceani]REE83095.1 GT2 family glycosyltransferase [Lutibacter oceani]